MHKHTQTSSRRRKNNDRRLNYTMKLIRANRTWMFLLSKDHFILFEIALNCLNLVSIVLPDTSVDSYKNRIFLKLWILFYSVVLIYSTRSLSRFYFFYFLSIQWNPNFNRNRSLIICICRSCATTLQSPHPVLPFVRFLDILFSEFHYKLFHIFVLFCFSQWIQFEAKWGHGCLRWCMKCERRVRSSYRNGSIQYQVIYRRRKQQHPHRIHRPSESIQRSGEFWKLL